MRKSALLAVYLATVCGAYAQATPQALYSIDVEDGLSDAPPAGAALDVRLNSQRPDLLIDALNNATVNQVRQRRGGVVQARLAGRDTLTRAPAARDLAASFLIDFEEPPVQTLMRRIVATFGADITPFTLRGAVAATIDSTDYSRAFDAASVVATNRTGDCTEYAVLLTAVARSLGLPARTVIGEVIVHAQGQTLAFGHAWTEIWYGGQWVLTDAAIDDAIGVRHYLPVSELKNEGYGYTLALISATQAMPTIRRVRLGTPQR